MTGRQLFAWLRERDALDRPLILRGTVDLGDGDEDNTESDLDVSRLDVRDGEVTVWCP